jgi:Arc/MetJ family transcription regulator
MEVAAQGRAGSILTSPPSRITMSAMRTTLTLDDDVAAKLQQYARRKRLPFKEVVNAVLRRGLVAPESRRSRNQRFRVDVFTSSFRPGVDLLRLSQLSDDLETEEASARSGR